MLRIDDACVLFVLFVLACGPAPRSHDDTSGDDDSASSDAKGGGVDDACASAASSKSYMGCEYWAVDLDNAIEVLGGATPPLTCAQAYGQGVATMQKVCALGGSLAGLCDPPDDACPMGYTCQQKSVCALDAQHAPFAIVVSNPQSTAVDVTVTSAAGATLTRTVQAGQVETILPQQSAMPDLSLDGTGKLHAAYRITSTLPIVAYQFNPLDNVDVFSNDASLLVPRSAFDVDYFGISWPTLDRRHDPTSTSMHDYHGYLTIVSAKDGTKIEVTPSANVLASATQPAIAAGTPTTFTLDAFDTLNFEAAGPEGDLTGTRIRSVDGVTTFGVFAGHEAASFGETTPPDSTNTHGPCCADHLEEMVFPTSTWGKTYSIARSAQRAHDNDVLRIVAARPGTSVTFSPAPVDVLDGDCAHLAAGSFCTVKIAVDTAIEATEPVLVGHYLESAIWNGGGNGAPPTSVGNGDPSMSIAVPTEQFRTDYTILIPNAYEQNFLSISAGTAGTVTVDGNAVSLDAAAGGAFRTARYPVTAGQHTIQCPDHCGVEVYGYSDAVSYMFAGGLDLRPIVLAYP